MNSMCILFLPLFSNGLPYCPWPSWRHSEDVYGLEADYGYYPDPPATDRIRIALSQRSPHPPLLSGSTVAVAHWQASSSTSTTAATVDILPPSFMDSILPISYS